MGSLHRRRLRHSTQSGRLCSAEACPSRPGSNADKIQEGIRCINRRSSRPWTNGESLLLMVIRSWPLSQLYRYDRTCSCPSIYRLNTYGMQRFFWNNRCYDSLDYFSWGKVLMEVRFYGIYFYFSGLHDSCAKRSY